MNTTLRTAPTRPPFTTPDEPTPGALDKVMASIRRIGSVSEVLRILGAGAMVVSMILFLLQGWDDGTDLDRYLILLTQTGLLAAAGFALGHLLGEARGARVCFGLTLISVPVNFTVLGALVYSSVQWDAGLSSYPQFAHWQVVDPVAFAIAGPLAVALLVPLTLFAFAVLARPQWRALSWHYLAVNAALLLPVRGSMIAGALALAAAALAWWRLRPLYRETPALTTTEGRFALLCFAIAPVILLVRSSLFYDVDSLVAAVLALAAFVALRQTRRVPERGPGMAIVLECLMAVVGFAAALAIADLSDIVLNGLGPAVAFALAFALLALDIVRGTDSRGLAATLTVVASTMLATATLLALADRTTLTMALTAAAIGIAMLSWGVLQRRHSATAAGGVTLIGAATLGAEPVIRLFVDGGWLTLALLGGGAIVGASLLDRYGPALRQRIASVTARELGD